VIARPYLTRRERQLYDLLRLAEGRVVTLAEIVADMYGATALDTDQSVVKSFVFRLRKKGIAVTNVPGQGYALGDLRLCPGCGGPLKAGT
jgi:DNA-binding response OmpR family regulator